MDSVLLGIDSGTSVVKSVVFDLDGNEIAVARRDTPVLTRVPDGSEMDMLAAWELTAETIAEVVQAIPDRHIAGVGICGTAAGVWPVSADGSPARDAAILWNDGRAADVIARWEANGLMRRAWDVSGNTMFPGYPLVALRWLAEHEVEVLARTRWLPFHKDWLRYKLTGDFHSDVSDVSYFPGDAHGRGYNLELFDFAELADCKAKVLTPAPSHQVVGHVTQEAAAITGLPVGTPVVAGAVDVVASALGGGAYRVGQACSILGTSFLNTLISDRPTFEPSGVGVQAGMPEGLWARSLVNTTGTLGIEWMVKTLAEPERQLAASSDQSVYDLIEEGVADVPVGSRGVVFLPYLNSAGIISPFTYQHARGQFFGLSLEHTRFDLMRAVYEGIALAMRDCYAVIEQPVEEVILVGGGARSAWWAQMFADASGRRIVIPGGTEFGARGAAILAGVGIGVFPSFDAAMSAFVHPDKAYEPRPDVAEAYTVLYDLYRHLYQNAREARKLRQEVLSRLSST